MNALPGRLGLAILLLVSPPAPAQERACAAMTDDAPAWFDARLDEAADLQSRGSAAAAWEALQQAAAGLPRRADVSLEPRCVGNPLWQRFYTLRREVTAALGRQQPDRAIDLYVRGGNLDDLDRLIDTLRGTARGTGRAAGALRSQLNYLDEVPGRGFTLLADETAASEAYRARLDRLAGWAREQAGALLAEEERILSGPATAEEQRIDAAAGSARDVAQAMTGMASAPGSAEAERERRRADRSLAALRDAQSWLETIGPAGTAPVRERASARGRALLGRAGDAAAPLEMRDALYETAGEYFELARDPAGRQAAADGRAAIAPALAGERERQDAAREARAAELERAAREQQNAMQKSDAEKQSFRDEADAMEAELGF